MLLNPQLNRIKYLPLPAVAKEFSALSLIHKLLSSLKPMTVSLPFKKTVLSIDFEAFKHSKILDFDLVLKNLINSPL